MYTVRHITDNFTHVAHISDFVADGSYPKMKRIAKADALAHKMWVRFMEHFLDTSVEFLFVLLCANLNTVE